MKIRSKNPIVIFIVVAGLLLFLHGVGALKGVENFLLFMVKPLGGRLYYWGASLNGSYNDTKNKEDLQVRVDELAKKVANLEVVNSHYWEMAEENKKLRTALDFLGANELKAVTAGVIAKDAASEDNRGLIINRGGRDGLRVGLGVISEEGAIIGRVTEIKDTTAKICLATSPGCQFPAAIQNNGKTQGITNGDLGLTIKMSYIPQLEKISPGETVVTSGLDANIPRGLVIGKVIQVFSESNEVWQEAVIEPLVNLDNLTVVSVIIP